MSDLTTRLNDLKPFPFQITKTGLQITSPEFRSFMITELVMAGELIAHGSEYYEDMGGHLLHESNLDYYIEHYIKTRSNDELAEMLERLDG